MVSPFDIGFVAKHTRLYAPLCRQRRVADPRWDRRRMVEPGYVPGVGASRNAGRRSALAQLRNAGNLEAAATPVALE